METIQFTVTQQRSADWKSQGATSSVKQAGGEERDVKAGDTYTLLSVMDMESSVMASLEISLSLALVAGAKM